MIRMRSTRMRTAIATVDPVYGMSNEQKVLNMTESG
jgi:hypothetical protein